ncbi:hypothetical protein D1007_24896 [Hordeum vulgare]|nr:hypothetical protein D1007_24896 [Hordeum vulgare]
MSQGPWLFRNMAVIFAPYDGYYEATDVPMVHMPIWLQSHKLPDGYCRADVVEKLLRSSGEILETRIAGNFRGDYIHVRVKHDVRKPLTKFVSIVKGKVRTVYAVRDLKDTASSPVKKSLPLAMEVDKSARKRLLVEHDVVVDPGQGVVPLLITDGKDTTNLDSPTTSSESKRAKKDDAQTYSDNLSEGSQNCRLNRVSDFLNDHGCGRVELLRQYFWQPDVESILKIRTSPRLWEDFISWPWERSGVLTVKSAYHVAMAVHYDQFSPGSSSANPAGDRPLWGLIWGAEVPPKLKTFAWQVVSGSLPTDVEKKRRHFDLNGFCQLCDQEQESSFHGLVACTNAPSLWDVMRLHWPLPDRPLIKWTCKEWLLQLLEESHVSIRSRIIMVLWRSCVEDIIKGKAPAVHDPICVHVKLASSLPWSPPPDGMVALSMDGSYCITDGSAGSGMVLRTRRVR